MRLAIYNQELSDCVEQKRAQIKGKQKNRMKGGSPASLALKLASLPPPQSPRGKVLGDINPNSLRKYGSASRHGKKTPLSTKMKAAATPKSRGKAHAAQPQPLGDSPMALLGKKQNSDIEHKRIAKALPFDSKSMRPKGEDPKSEHSSSSSASSLRSITTSSRNSSASHLSEEKDASLLSSPPSSKNTSSFLASIPNLKTPSPTATVRSKNKEVLDETSALGIESRAKKYRSPTDSFLSPISTALIPKGSRRVNARKALAERSISAASLGSSKSIENPPTKIMKTSASVSSLPKLSSKILVNNRLKSKLSSPSDGLFSPVSSHFMKRSKDGKKLVKLNVQKSIFLKNNRK